MQEPDYAPFLKILQLKSGHQHLTLFSDGLAFKGLFSFALEFGNNI